MSDLINRDMAIKEAYQIEVDGSSIDVVQVETLMALPSASSWISVKDRLPDKNGLYLTTMMAMLRGKRTYFVGICQYWAWSKAFDSDLKVLAWQDLPKPYEPKE